MLIAETPNVLILHLKRLEYNFETDRIEKLQSQFKFPHVLDLKPYSYYEVMGNEGRLESNENEQEPEEDDMAGVGKKVSKKEEESEFQHPKEEDCFEYKLVGVNVHQGSATSGHYWSYINTNRGGGVEEENDPNWLQTENDPWMEFNDSRVSDYRFENLDEDVTGDDDSKQTKSIGYYNQNQGNTFEGYGKSAYMLFYERRRKKDMKVVIPETEVEQVKQSGIEVTFDDEKNEHLKYIKYRESVENQVPN